MNKSIKAMVSLLLRGAAPAAAIALGASPPPVLSAPGDLDPGFGDFGRVGPIVDFAGPAWSAHLLGTGGTLFAGGDSVCDYYCSYYHSAPLLTSFAGELSDAGMLDSGFAFSPLKDTEVLDTALLPDGSIIAVGQTTVSRLPVLTVFKLSRSGALDTSFGKDGVFRLASLSHKGTSVTVDKDGRIVVAGPQKTPAVLIVVRLHPNGVIDDSFGTSGIFTGPPSDFLDSAIHVIGTGSGYRVTASDCSVIGLTSAGKLDMSFGTAGTVPLKASSGSAVGCNSLVAQPDGRLIAAGADGGQHAFAARLLTNGTIDSTFATSAIEAGFNDVSAVAVAADGSGSIVIAGSDPAGSTAAVVMRLQSSGAVDTTFGTAGTTLIDLPTDGGANPVIHDLLLRADGGVIAAGGDGYSRHPFVVRLLGAGSAAVPGVIGASQGTVTTNEQSGEAIVKVRRTGGAGGSVSVAYQTQDVDANSGPATAGQDYTKVSGRLSWNDGDTSEQEIHVPILADTITEEDEYFRVVLSDPQGGAGLGTRSATVDIQPDGSPYGLFSVGDNNVDEGTPAQIYVSRDYYTSGAVSVTVTPVAGTATAGTDFDPKPVTVSWGDGEGGAKAVTINIPDDSIQEDNETFTVKLSNPTGGALLGPRSTATITILANDLPAPPSSGGGSGGIGSMGFVSLLFLAVATLLRTISPALRRRTRWPDWRAHSTPRS